VPPLFFNLNVIGFGFWIMFLEINISGVRYQEKTEHRTLTPETFVFLKHSILFYFGNMNASWICKKSSWFRRGVYARYNSR